MCLPMAHRCRQRGLLCVGMGINHVDGLLFFTCCTLHTFCGGPFPTAILGPPQRSDCVVQQPACTFWAGLQVEGHLYNSRWALPFCSHERAHAVDTCCGTCPVTACRGFIQTTLWATIPFGQKREPSTATVSGNACRVSIVCLCLVHSLLCADWSVWLRLRQSCVRVCVLEAALAGPDSFEASAGRTLQCPVSFFGCDRGTNCKGNTAEEAAPTVKLRGPGRRVLQDG